MSLMDINNSRLPAPAVQAVRSWSACPCAYVRCSAFLNIAHLSDKYHNMCVSGHVYGPFVGQYASRQRASARATNARALARLPFHLQLCKFLLIFAAVIFIHLDMVRHLNITRIVLTVLAVTQFILCYVMVFAPSANIISSCPNNVF